MRISRTRSGLPRIIPAQYRIYIRNRNMGYTVLIRFYLSVFSVYRVLTMVGKPKLNTITDPGVYFNIGRFEQRMERFLELFVKDETRRLIPRFYFKQLARFFPIYRSSPQTSKYRAWPLLKIDPTGMWSSHPVSILEAVAIWKRDNLFPIVKEFSEHYFPRLSFLFKQLENIVPSHLTSNLGKLSFKEEAAGKVRVFALVDVITQWLLAPLHKHIFAILRRIPMDGTFNQLKPVYRLLRRQKRHHIPLYSLDLSAATDRLPISLQARLLDLLVQEIPMFGQKWAALLVSRKYRVFSKDYGINDKLRYSVGQPMGALSSWAMLALTHHFLVQVAAWDAGFPRTKLFQDYAILGDDIVIGNTKVKNAYLSILSEIGVSCGLHKSLLSPKGLGLEFAKSTFVDGVNVSPLSLKELKEAISDLSSWSAFASKWDLNFSRQAQILGYGYLARRKSFRKLNHALQCVTLALVAKVDLNTDILRLRRGNTLKNFDTSALDLFKRKVLKKVNSFLFREMNAYPRLNFADLIRQWGWDFDFKLYTFDHFKAAYNAANFAEVIDIVKKLDKASKPLGNLSKIKTFDDAIKVYLEVLHNKAVANLNYFKLIPPLVRGKANVLPFQLRLFRAWSRVSHKIVKDFRETTKPRTDK